MADETQRSENKNLTSIYTFYFGILKNAEA